MMIPLLSILLATASFSAASFTIGYVLGVRHATTGHAPRGAEGGR